ncbi:hypothetical protein JCM19274_3152 [Algibacter lectus]|uniref:Uncharacterized protein n=1 Tax=Algibacter lectus TaxID=221126 RepID=A0A090WRH7_9FLAO|nr:hypothetical protein JCM19274_3152 [Algibacter lectus]
MIGHGCFFFEPVKFCRLVFCGLRGVQSKNSEIFMITYLSETETVHFLIDRYQYL